VREREIGSMSECEGVSGGRGEVVTLALHLMWVRKLSHSRNNNKFRNFFFSDHFVSFRMAKTKEDEEEIREYDCTTFRVCCCCYDHKYYHFNSIL